MVALFVHAILAYRPPYRPSVVGRATLQKGRVLGIFSGRGNPAQRVGGGQHVPFHDRLRAVAPQRVLLRMARVIGCLTAEEGRNVTVTAWQRLPLLG